MARPGGAPGFPYRPDGTKIGGVRKHGVTLNERMQDAIRALYPERLRARFNGDQYDPVVDMALVAMSTDDVEVRLLASSKVAPYIHAAKKHVEIDDKRSPAVKDQLIEQLIELALSGRAVNVTPEGPVQDVPKVLEHEPRKPRRAPVK